MTETSDPSAAAAEGDEGIGLRHHLPEETLLDYAAGAASAPLALLVACHLALCARCREALASLEAVGGALLTGIEPAALPAEAKAALLARLDQPVTVEPAPAPAGDADLPLPLRRLLDRPVATLQWRPLVPGLRDSLLMQTDGDTLRLLAIDTGHAMPRHSHRGNELTMVLRGGLSDNFGQYHIGDVAVADSAVDHRPRADRGEDCLCLAMTDAPRRLTGPIGRWFSSFIKF